MVKKVAYCIGNGETRKGYDLQKLRDIGPLYGCGAIWRDNHVDNLICCNKFRAREAVTNGAHLRSNFYTRKDWAHYLAKDKVRVLPDLPYFGLESYQQPINWGSGLYAVYTAIKEEADVIMLLGYDFYGSGKGQKRTNNMYKNTEHYRNEKQGPRDPSKWIAQFQLLFKHFYNITFIFIKPEDYPHPVEFDAWRYVLYDTYEGLDRFVDSKLQNL